jgi:nucleoside-diphosphate-sugar epimerase
LNILITGASGDLGSRTARHLLPSSHRLYLLKHKTALPSDLATHSDVMVRAADLAQPLTLNQACDGIDCIVHLAGVLFEAEPEKFLPKTNIGYVKSIVQALRTAGVKKFILVSFPHVEGETTPERPAVGRVDGTPDVIHFRTQLEAERYVIAAGETSSMIPVVFRAGIVYGENIKLMRAARWMLQRHLMAIWKKPTWVHLLALPDFLAALQAAIENEHTRGIYQVCDDAPLLLQDFVDKLADHWKCHRAFHCPDWMFPVVGGLCETAALVLRTAAPLNRDIVRAGMTSCVADTSRMKRELLPKLAYPSVDDGLSLL